jgi:hypothetical protein
MLYGMTAAGDCQPDRPNRSNGSYAISKPPAVFNVVHGDEVAGLVSAIPPA